MPKSQTEALFLAHIAFPRFRENPELIPRVFQKSASDKSRMSISETREERVPGFHENAEMRSETRMSSQSAISASRRAAQKCKKTHFF